MCNCDNYPLVEEIQEFKNGTKHLRTSCKGCGRFRGFKQQSIKDDYILYFGKYKGEKLIDIKDNDYLAWLLEQDFIKNNLKEKIKQILNDK